MAYKRPLQLPVTPVSNKKPRSTSRGRSRSPGNSSNSSTVRILRNLASSLSRSRSSSQSPPRNRYNRATRVKTGQAGAPSYTTTTTKTSRRGRRSYGASSSKSAGYFNQALSINSIADKCATQGVVRKTETGDVLEDSRRVTYCAHSTMPNITVLQSVIGAMMKKLFKKASMQIKNWDVPLITAGDSNSNVFITLKFRRRDGTEIESFTFIVTPTLTTLQFLTESVVTWFQSTWPSNIPTQFLELSMSGTEVSGILPITPLAKIDLTTAYVHIHSSSHLKIQNRTVTTSANDNSDDVDNVPIYGKSYDYLSNTTMYRDYATNTALSTPPFTTHPIWGVLRANVLPLTDGTKMFDEVPLSTQFVGIKKAQKAHLDPGEIKTSVLKDFKSIGLSKFFQTSMQNAGNFGPSPPEFNFKQTWLGKSRLFAFEKMIDAVAATEENRFKLAYEHSLMVGCLFFCKDDYQTAPQVSNYIGKV